MPTLCVTTWYLEMDARPLRAPRSAPRGMHLARVPHPSVPFVRFLYETIGREWLWIDRRRMPDTELAAIVGDPAVETFVAYADGAPVGWFELDRRMPGQCELAYFGLFPEWIGRGAGAWLLDEAIERAWEPGPHRVWVHTCSLDHARALSTYERAGFVRYDEAVFEIDDPRPLPVTPR